MKFLVFVAIIGISLVAGVPTSSEVSSSSNLPTNERIIDGIIGENPLFLLIAIILLLIGQGGGGISSGFEQGLTIVEPVVIR